MEGLKLVPPFRFALVCCSPGGANGGDPKSSSVPPDEKGEDRGEVLVREQIYRGAYPTLRNLLFLKTLRLSTIVSFVNGGKEAITVDLLDFCKAEKISLVVVDLQGQKLPSQESMSQVMSLLLDRKRLPAFIHCSDGGRYTGICVMCLRMLQRWSLESAMSESVRYVKDGISSDARNFVSSFSADFRDMPEPAQRPSWLV